MARLLSGKLFGFRAGGPTNEHLYPLPKGAAKPVWAKQLTRLPCLVVYAKFQLAYNGNPAEETINLSVYPYKDSRTKIAQ